jgi:hypothetical protein
VIPQGLPAREVAYARSADEPLHIVASISSTPRQGAMAQLARLADEFCVNSAGVVMTILGAGPAKDALAGMFAPQVTAGTIRLPGNVDAVNLGTILRQAHIFVLPTLPSDGPVGIADAMNTGLTVIRSAGKVGEGDWVIEGETGYVIPRGDVHAWIDTVQMLVSDHALLMRLRQAAHTLAREQSVGVPVMQNNYAELIDVMLAEIRSGSFVTPGPIITHPQLGGLSLPPAFQTDPDEKTQLAQRR